MNVNQLSGIYSTSHVTSSDIFEAGQELEAYLSNEDNIYLAMIETELIQSILRKAFNIIMNQDKYDMSMNEHETSVEYNDRLNLMNAEIRKEKLQFLKMK